MGLNRTMIAGAVKTVFNALGNVPEACTFRRTASVYNPATGVVTQTNTDYAIKKAVFTKFENFEIDKTTVLGSDVKYIMQRSELSITPSTATDKIVRTSDGKIYNILRVSTDPAAATITLQLRSPS